MEVNASYTVAANFLVAKRNADPNIIAGEVEPCHRKSRRRVVCPSYVIRSGTPKLRCDYQAIICATRKGKAFLKVTAETCVTAPPPWN